VNLSSGQKLGALLAAVLPLVASIYGQQAERRQRNQERAEELQVRVQAERKAEAAADAASAEQLNRAFQQFASPVAEVDKLDLCATLHSSLELLRQSPPAPRTDAVAAAWLTYRPDDDDGSDLLVCKKCRRTIEFAARRFSVGRAVAADQPLPGERSADFKKALSDADLECSSGPTSKVAEASPTPTASRRASVEPTPRRAGGSPTVSPAVQPTEPALATPTAARLRPQLKRPDPGARIYIQVPDAETKARIQKARLALQTAGYRVHDIEIVGERRAPKCPELRYVYAADKAEAEVLLSDLNNPENRDRLDTLNVPDQPALPNFTLARMGRYAGRTLNRVYELWLPADGGKKCIAATPASPIEPEEMP
jgi:hypothetical protein